MRLNNSRYSILLDLISASLHIPFSKSLDEKYLDELEKELKNVYETLTRNTKKKEDFRKKLLNWVKKYAEDLKNREKKVI